MIVKVQLPVMTNEDPPKFLVYNEDRSIEGMLPVSPELVEAMEGELRAFFDAEVDDQGVIHLNLKVEEQGW